MNHGVVVKGFTPKYLFRIIDVPKISPEEINANRSPAIEYARSFFVKRLIFNAFNISLIPLFPSAFTITIAQTKRGMNRKYPVINQYIAALIIKTDFTNGDRVKRSRKKYNVNDIKIRIAFNGVI